MRPESFDLPYAPFTSAFWSIGRVYLIATAVSLVLAVGFAFANRWGQFSEPATVSRAGEGVSGAVGGGISFQVQDLSVNYPGEEGVVYFAQAFYDEESKARIHVTRSEVDDQGARRSTRTWRIQSDSPSP